MKSEFDDVTEAKIQKIKKLMEELSTEACAHVVDSIFAGCIHALVREGELAGEIGCTLEADATIVLLVKDGQYRLEAGHVKGADTALIETLDAISLAIKETLSPRMSEKVWIH